MIVKKKSKLGEVEVKVKESEVEESEQKEFKRPPKDKMVKRATVSK